MTDVSQGPGWWLASDGKWYPPELAVPDAPDPVPAPNGTPAPNGAPSPLQHRLPPRPGPAAAPAHGAVLGTPRQASPAPMSPPADAPRAPETGRAPATGIGLPTLRTTFPATDDLAIRRPPITPPPVTRPPAWKSTTAASATKKRRRHVPIFTLVALAVLGGATATVLELTLGNRPDVHRSPVAVSEDFLGQFFDGRAAGIHSDLLPGQSVDFNLTQTQGADFGATSTSSDQNFVDTDVHVLTCPDNAGEPCTTTTSTAVEVTVPTQQTNGKWYVDETAIPTCGSAGSASSSVQVVCRL